MRRIISSLALVAVFFLVSQRAYCCVCEPEVDPRQALQEATAVFVGRVMFKEVIFRKVGENDQKMSFVPEAQVKFEVEKSWKGGENRELIVRTSAGDCGYQFTVGERYLVYAYNQDILTTSGCTRTKSLAQATADLKELGRPRKKRKP